MTGPQRRVAITGLGLVTPAGNDVATTWASPARGPQRCGAPIRPFDASGFSTRIAAEVKGFDAARVDRRPQAPEVREPIASVRARRGGAGDRAMPAFAPTDADAARWGCVVGHRDDGRDLRRARGRPASDAAPNGELDPSKPRSTRRRPHDPLVFCRSQSTAGVSLLLRRFGIAGYATSVHTACASGGQAIGTAMKLIRRGAADRVLAGGFDSMVNPVGLAGFCLLCAVSPDNDDAGAREPAVRCDPQRLRARRGRGLRRARGMGQRARRAARGSTPSSPGDGNSLSCYRITDSHPSGDGPIQAMRRALADAGAGSGRRRLPERARHVDADERPERVRRGPRRCSATDVGKVAVSSTKSVMGHLIAGAGAVEAAICALAITAGRCPSTRTCASSIRIATLDIVRGEPRRRRVRVALSNSLGFGGSNSCIALRHPEEVDGRPGSAV